MLLLLLLIFTSFSCASNNDEPDSDFKGKQQLEKWQLVQMTGSVADVPPTTGSDMSWQEYYQLHPDKTFIKSRQVDSRKTEATGTYNFITLSDDTYLELTYESDNDIIGNCTGDTKELLRLSSENKLTATWWACDGPGLFYERVE